MDLPEWLTPHEVTIEPRLGEGVGGTVYGPPVPARAHVEYVRKLVRTAAGKQIATTGLVILPLDAVADLPTDSRITVDGRPRVAAVVARQEFDDATPNHWEVRLL